MHGPSITGLVALLVFAGQGHAHEFWLEPTDYLTPPGAPIEADIVNGQNFEGASLAYLPDRLESYEIRLGSAVEPIRMRIGDRPALNVEPLGEGLHVVTYVSRPQRLTYDSWDIFMSVVREKDLLGGPERVTALHLARGLPQEDVTERFSRYAKTLVGVGSAAGTDVETGMAMELVALDNPYLVEGEGEVRVRLLFGGEPRVDAQVEIFERSPEGETSFSTARTDVDGVAVVAVADGHEYLVNSVFLRLPVDARADGAMWETLWSSLTFALTRSSP